MKATHHPMAQMQVLGVLGKQEFQQRFSLVLCSVCCLLKKLHIISSAVGLFCGAMHYYVHSTPWNSFLIYESLFVVLLAFFLFLFRKWFPYCSKFLWWSKATSLLWKQVFINSHQWQKGMTCQHVKPCVCASDCICPFLWVLLTIAHVIKTKSTSMNTISVV